MIQSVSRLGKPRKLGDRSTPTGGNRGRSPYKQKAYANETRQC